MKKLTKNLAVTEILRTFAPFSGMRGPGRVSHLHYNRQNK